MKDCEAASTAGRMDTNSMQKELNLEEMINVTGGTEDPIVRYTVRWYDESGKEYSYTVDNSKPKPEELIKGMSVTYQDAGGHTYTTTIK